MTSPGNKDGSSYLDPAYPRYRTTMNCYNVRWLWRSAVPYRYCHSNRQILSNLLHLDIAFDGTMYN